MPVKNFDLSIIVFEKSTGTCFVYVTWPAHRLVNGDDSVCTHAGTDWLKLTSVSQSQGGDRSAGAPRPGCKPIYHPPILHEYMYVTQLPLTIRLQH